MTQIANSIATRQLALRVSPVAEPKRENPPSPGQATPVCQAAALPRLVQVAGGTL